LRLVVPHFEWWPNLPIQDALDVHKGEGPRIDKGALNLLADLAAHADPAIAQELNGDILNDDAPIVDL